MQHTFCINIANCGNLELLLTVRNDSVPKVEAYEDLPVDGSTITFSCPRGLVLIGPKLSIYQRLVLEFKGRGKAQVISQSQFFEVWKTHFHHVTIPKVGDVTQYGTIIYWLCIVQS